MNAAASVAALALGVCLLAHPALAHDQITAESRTAFLARLAELQRQLAGAAPSSPVARPAASPTPATPRPGAGAARARAHLELGLLVDEIRALLNADILGHGRTQGLETMLLLNQLAKSPEPLRPSPSSGFYPAAKHHYRQALALGLAPGEAALARYRLLKSLFYDSFTVDPMRTETLDRDEAIELLGHGEALLAGGHPEVDAEEVAFVLGVGYLRAQRLQIVPAAEARTRVPALIEWLRRQRPQSLKLMTLQVLADGG